VITDFRKPLKFYVFVLCKKALCPIFQFEFRNLRILRIFGPPEPPEPLVEVRLHAHVVIHLT
jgi:hypothetical protein